MSDRRQAEKRRIWKHRLRQCENVSISLVTKNGKPILEIIVHSELPAMQQERSHSDRDAARRKQSPDNI
jgi:hypothetical protein